MPQLWQADPKEKQRAIDAFNDRAKLECTKAALLERERCVKAVLTTLANWRCVPSQATREFAELCIREIEESKP